jgi:hypothetical protein
MKSTFFILACLVYLAASSFADEEEVHISKRKIADLTKAEEACVIPISVRSKPVQVAITK